MPQIDFLLELHHFSGGLKSTLIGVQGLDRPSWLPESDLIGLHNDIRPKKDEFIVEFSRHARESNLLTWIGAYTFGVDAIYGDRANYIGIGVWLCNRVVSDPEGIIDALVKILKKVSTSDVQSCLSHCEKLINDYEYINSWLFPKDKLPILNVGIPFDSSRHPTTAYLSVNSGTFDQDIALISNSILINSFSSGKDRRVTSRILYLISGEETQRSIENKIEHLKYQNASSIILEYMHSSIQEANSLSTELTLKIQRLNDQRRQLADEKSLLERDLESAYEEKKEWQLIAKHSRPSWVLFEALATYFSFARLWLVQTMLSRMI